MIPRDFAKKINNNIKNNAANNNANSKDKGSSKNGLADISGTTLPGFITCDQRLNAIIIRDSRENLPFYEEIIKTLDVPCDVIKITLSITSQPDAVAELIHLGQMILPIIIYGLNEYKSLNSTQRIRIIVRFLYLICRFYLRKNYIFCIASNLTSEAISAYTYWKIYINPRYQFTNIFWIDFVLFRS